MKFLAHLAVILIFVLLHPTSAKAHPHAWIDLETSLIMNDKGEVEGLWVGWLFDDFYSAFTLDEMKRGPDGSYNQQELDALAELNLSNLAEFSYFTFINVDGATAPHQQVTEYKTYVTGNRLWMEFSVMLEKPVSIHKHRVDYAVYDPTYYVEVLHAEKGDPISIAAPSALNCGYSVTEPNPTMEMTMMAAAPDQDENPSNELGQLFAEWVHVTCR